MSEAKKSKGDTTHSHVNLIDGDGNIRPVNGETDSTLYYKGVPVGVWEDKNFDFQLANTAELAQAFAEVHYSAEEISKRVSLRLCSGILTSGLNWTFILNSCRKGNIIHDRTIPVVSLIPHKLHRWRQMLMV